MKLSSCMKFMVVIGRLGGNRLTFLPTTIRDAIARKVFDSRGFFSIEVDIYTESGFGSFSSPSGASRGRYEAVAFPPGGVDEAVSVFESDVAPELIGLDSSNQFEIDSVLIQVDGTDNFSKIGGSTAISTSIANAKAAASSLGLPLYRYLGGMLSYVLPLPLGNVVGGGVHSRAGLLDVQEILVLPIDVDSFLRAAEVNVSVYWQILRVAPSNVVLGRNDEGAWIVNLEFEDALKLVRRACDYVEEKFGVKIGVGVDVAASSLWDEEKGKYVYPREGLSLSSEEQFKFVRSVIEEFNLVYVEDPFREDDFSSFAELTELFPNRLICGDDLYVTNAERISYGVRGGCGNSVIIKPNQVGTLTGVVWAVNAALSGNFIPIMSHRSGENVDPSIAHLAVAFRCPIIKTGVVGGERIAKINELIRIEEDLGEKAEIARLEVE